MSAPANNIQVMVRVRPLNDRERREGAKSCITFSDENPNMITLDCKPETKTFVFDFVGGEKTTQEDIFNVCGRPITHACLEGYNACIFAYGQTGAGKTFTMQGKGLELESAESAGRGLQPRVFDYLFGTTTQEKRENPGTEFLIKCCYLEIYNEQIMDLLSSTSGNLQVREDLKKGVYVEGLSEEGAKSSEDAIELLRKGARNRHVGATNMNFESSRSHSVFSMTIESKKIVNAMTVVRISKLHFVDLAGSERQKQTAAAGDRLKEAGNINKSLTVLGTVINSLVEMSQGKARHVPYRDSKLTFILKDSLGGNSRTTMIAAASAASTSFQETLSTLKFAQRAKMIKNKASINEESSGNLETFKLEIKRLKDELAQARNLVLTLELENKRYAAKRTPIIMEIEKSSPQGECDYCKRQSTGGSKMEEEEEIPNQHKEKIQSYFRELNDQSLELEKLFKKNIDLMQDTEIIIETELNKKENDLIFIKASTDLWQRHELNYRMLIYVYKNRVERYAKMIDPKTREEVTEFISEESLSLEQENNNLLDLLKDLPYITRIWEENVILRESLEKYEGESNPTSSISIINQLNENVEHLRELSIKLDQSIAERKKLTDRIEWYEVMKQGTPEKMKKIEDTISALKLDHNDKVEKLNNEIISLKQNELEFNRALEKEKKKNIDTQREVGVLKDQKQKEAIQYEQRISEILEKFQRVEREKAETSSDLEQKNSELKIKILELEDKCNSLKQKLELLEKASKSKDEMIEKSNDERDKLKQDLLKENDGIIKEKSMLENTLHKLEDNLRITMEDLNKSKAEIMHLNNRILSLNEEGEKVRESMESLIEEKLNLQKSLDTILVEKNDNLVNLENLFEKEKGRIEILENEKKRMQEELDTSNQTFNYQMEELVEKRKTLEQIQIQVIQKEKTANELKEKLEIQEKFIESLKNQLSQKLNTATSVETHKNDDSSPLNLALLENQQLKDQNNELRTQLELESNQNMGLRAQLHESMLHLEQVSLSCEHYRAAYLEIREQIQNNSQKNKELQHSLSVKEIDFLEVQKNLKFTQEKLDKVAKKNLELKNEIREQKSLVAKLNNDYRFTKEKIITLQDSLREKIEEIQLIISQKKQLEKDLNQLSRQNELMKIDFENKTNSLEARYNEVLDMYNQGQKEIRDIKLILNVKIEENINFENNVKILSSKLEQLSSEEYKARQRQEFERHSGRLKEQREQLETLQQKVEILTERASGLEREKVFYESKHKETVKLLKGKLLEDVLMQRDEAKEELSQIQSYFSEMQEKFKNVLVEKEQKIRQLEASSSNNDSEAGFKDRYFRLEQSFTSSKNSLKAKEGELMQLKQELRNQISEKENILNEARKLNKEFQDMAMSYQEVISENDKLKLDFESLQIALQSGTDPRVKMMAMLKEENVKLKDSLEQEKKKQNEELGLKSSDKSANKRGSSSKKRENAFNPGLENAEQDSFLLTGIKNVAQNIYNNLISVSRLLVKKLPSLSESSNILEVLEVYCESAINMLKEKDRANKAMRGELEEKDSKMSELEKEVENLRFERRIQIKNSKFITDVIEDENTLNPVEEFDKFSDRTNLMNSKTSFNNFTKDLENIPIDSIQKKQKLISTE